MQVSQLNAAARRNVIDAAIRRSAATFRFAACASLEPLYDPKSARMRA